MPGFVPMRASPGAPVRALVIGALLALPALALADTDPPQVKHSPVTQARTGEPITIACDIIDQSEVFQPLVYWRPQGGASYANVPLRPVEGTRFEAVIGGSASAGVIEYFIETFDEFGNGPARVASEDRPLRIQVVAPSAAAAASKPPPAPSGTAAAAPAPTVHSGSGPFAAGGPLYSPGGFLLDRTWTWVAAGGGGATAVLGVLLGVSALGAAADYKKLLTELPAEGHDPAKVRAAFNGANGLAAASTTFWILAAISAAGAGTLFVLEAPPGSFQFAPPEAPPPSDAITLLVIPTGTGVALAATF